MEKQRKFLLMIPLLVIPFVTMAFWALGGGKAAAAHPQPSRGIDMTLPAAQFKKDQKEDKLSVYQAAAHDSVQSGISPAFIKALGMKETDSIKLNKPGGSTDADQSAANIQAKLAQINHQLSQPQPQPATYDDQENETSEQHIKELHRMMKSVNTADHPDPQMAQLSKMLTQIQQIQNPGSVKAVPQKSSDTKAFKAIPAIIDGKQKVMDGGAVKLKLTDTVTMKGQLLPKGQEIFGVCSVTNQRLLLTIQNIRLAQQIIPVNLTVFSLDGMPGIPAPEAELGGAAGSGADEAVQSMQILSMDQSLGAQAAAGGVNAAKGLFSKKIKKIKVKLRDAYPVLLKINH